MVRAAACSGANPKRDATAYRRECLGLFGETRQSACQLVCDFGFSRRGDRLKVFANSKTMDGYIGRDLREKLDNPLIFQRPGAAAASAVPAHMNGYDATILIDICQAILNAKADGKLAGVRYDKMIEQAQILLKGVSGQV